MERPTQERSHLLVPHVKRHFAQSCGLKKHGRNHPGEKPFACTTCEKTFTQSCGLKIHGKTHTEEKSFASTSCEKTFAQICDLKIYGRNSCVCLYMTLQVVLIDKGPFTYHCRKMAVFLCVSLHDTSGGSD